MNYKLQTQIETDIAQLESKYSKQRQRTKTKALADIETTRTLFLKRKSQYGYELKQLDKMEVYVKKHKFMPASYERMLTMWTANFLGKYSR